MTTTCFAKGCTAAETGTTRTGRPACDRHLTGGRRHEPTAAMVEWMTKFAPDPFPPATLVEGGVLVDGVFLSVTRL